MGRFSIGVALLIVNLPSFPRSSLIRAADLIPENAIFVEVSR